MKLLEQQILREHYYWFEDALYGDDPKCRLDPFVFACRACNRQHHQAHPAYDT